MLDFADKHQVKYVATGHYARVKQAADGLFQLHRATDLDKDQSYMLSQLSQSELSRTIFPLGDLSKEEVRQMARDINLNVAGRKDSQDLCFVDRQDYHTFLQENLHDRNQAGEIRTRAGKILGQHQGWLLHHWAAQRSACLHPGALCHRKDPLTNTLIVGTTDELGKTSFYVADPNWISGTTTDFPLNCDVKIRYRAKLAPAQLTLTNNGNVLVELADPLRDITPGQAAVFLPGRPGFGRRNNYLKRSYYP